MKSFRTTTGRVLETTITVDVVKRVKALTGINLLIVPDKPEMLKDLSADPITFIDLIYAVVKRQLDDAGVTDEQFGEMLDGTAIEDATSAFLEGLVDFFPGARGAMLRRVLDRATNWMAKSDAKITEAMENGEIDAAIDSALSQLTDGNSSTKSQDAPESSPSL